MTITIALVIAFIFSYVGYFLGMTLGSDHKLHVMGEYLILPSVVTPEEITRWETLTHSRAKVILDSGRLAIPISDHPEPSISRETVSLEAIVNSTRKESQQ